MKMTARSAARSGSRGGRVRARADVVTDRQGGQGRRARGGSGRGRSVGPGVGVPLCAGRACVVRGRRLLGSGCRRLTLHERALQAGVRRAQVPSPNKVTYWYSKAPTPPRSRALAASTPCAEGLGETRGAKLRRLSSRRSRAASPARLRRSLRCNSRRGCATPAAAACAPLCTRRDARACASPTRAHRTCHIRKVLLRSLRRGSARRPQPTSPRCEVRRDLGDIISEV